MTTASWSLAGDHTSDALFRAWGSDYNTHLAAIGLVQTTDTGQINWATVTRPGAAFTAAGYEIWRFNDLLQSGYPIFIKLEYGNGPSTVRPSMWITAGTGTDGAGNITGTTSTRRSLGPSAGGAVQSNSTAFPSYFCHAEGFAGAAFRVGWIAGAMGGWAVHRFNDSSGTPTGDGFVLYACTNTGSPVSTVVQSVRTASPGAGALTGTNSDYCLFPHSETVSTTENGDLQVFVHYAPMKRLSPLFGICSYFTGEISQGTTFSTKLVGTSARTFIAVGAAIGRGHSSIAAAGMALLWE